MFAPLAKCYDGITVRTIAKSGDVMFVFHTYHGFLVLVAQTEHRVCAAPDDARILLWRLHRFNLTWGLFAYGAIFIPVLSLFNYAAQKRAIARQENPVDEPVNQGLLAGVVSVVALLNRDPRADDDALVKYLINEGLSESLF